MIACNNPTIASGPGLVLSPVEASVGSDLRAKDGPLPVLVPGGKRDTPWL